MIRNITNALAVSAVAASMMFGMAPQVQARDGDGIGLGIAAGIIGLGVGAAIEHDRYYGPHYSRYDDGRCFYGDRVCHWTNRHCFENEYGDTVCRGGRYLCERPLICD